MEAAAVCCTVSGMRVGTTVRVICMTSMSSMVIVTMISVLIRSWFNLYWAKRQSEPHAEGVVRSNSCGEYANPTHPLHLLHVAGERGEKDDVL